MLGARGIRGKFPYALVLACLVMTAFFFGGAIRMSYLVVGCMAFAAFASLFYPASPLASSERRLGRLLRYPPFYFCLVLGLYVLVQALNPSFEEIKTEGGFVLKPLAHVDFLPSSVSLVSTGGISARLFCMLAVFALLLGAEASVRSRRAALALCGVVFYSGAALAVLALLNKVLGMDIFWHILPSETNSGTFIYHAQGNVYFICAMAFGSMLLAIFSENGAAPKFWQRPSVVMPGCALIYSAVFVSGGLGGLVVGGVYFIFICAFYMRRFFGSRKRFAACLAVLLALCGCAFFAVAKGYVSFGDMERVHAKFEEGLNNEMRGEIKLMTWDMVKSGGSYPAYKGLEKTDAFNIFYGRGLDSYQGLSVPYFAENLEFQKAHGGNGYLIPGRAHCDPLELLFELGIAGVSIIVLWFAWFAREVFRLRRANVRAVVPALAGMALILAYSFNDIIFSNMFLSMNYAVLSVIILKVLRSNIAERQNIKY